MNSSSRNPQTDQCGSRDEAAASAAAPLARHFTRLPNGLIRRNADDRMLTEAAARQVLSDMRSAAVKAMAGRKSIQPIIDLEDALRSEASA